MSKGHPTALNAPVKPEKPSPDFPLFPHTVGQARRRASGRGLERVGNACVTFCVR
jgi:hypothetical protein